MNQYLLAEQATTGVWAQFVEFYQNGGVIMHILSICSILSVAVIIYKVLSLEKERVLPVELRSKVNSYVENGDEASAKQLGDAIEQSDSVLGRLSQVVMKRSVAGRGQIREAVTASAHREMVGLHGGIQVLDVVIVVAPLLGLLGTASGITTVFDGMSSLEDVKMNVMARGVAEALTTTIAGLAVAVPAVVGHSIFNRKIEKYASQLEVVMEDFVTAVDSGAQKSE